jgi:tRNA-dihydrouridine synthase
MLARHAVGRPWLFAEILDDAPPPTREACLAEVRRFAADVMGEMGARSVGYLRQFWPRYRRAGVLDKELAHALMLASEAAVVRELLGS